MDDLDVVLHLSGGAFRVPLCTAAKILGIEPQTIYNRRAVGKWPLQPLADDSGRVFFRADDIATMLARQSRRSSSRGAPSKAERVKAAAEGLTVAEWRLWKGKTA